MGKRKDVWAENVEWSSRWSVEQVWWNCSLALQIQVMRKKMIGVMGESEVDSFEVDMEHGIFATARGKCRDGLGSTFVDRYQSMPSASAPP